MKGLRDNLGCTGQCGKCGRHVKKLRDQVLSEMEIMDYATAVTAFATA